MVKESSMKRLFGLGAAALMLASLVADEASAQRRGIGGGGMHGPAFAGGMGRSMGFSRVGGLGVGVAGLGVRRAGLGGPALRGVGYGIGTAGVVRGPGMRFAGGRR